MGKAHALLEDISESADTTTGPKALTAGYGELTAGGAPTRTRPR